MSQASHEGTALLSIQCARSAFSGAGDNVQSAKLWRSRQIQDNKNRETALQFRADASTFNLLLFYYCIQCYNNLVQRIMTFLHNILSFFIFSSSAYRLALDKPAEKGCLWATKRKVKLREVSSDQTKLIKLMKHINQSFSNLCRLIQAFSQLQGSLVAYQKQQAGPWSGFGNLLQDVFWKVLCSPDELRPHALNPFKP